MRHIVLAIFLTALLGGCSTCWKEIGDSGEITCQNVYLSCPDSTWTKGDPPAGKTCP